ncbi:hypothetical protein MMC10_003989 [Thelotrema lepadinum]|nr:hypothetical protein [Thelotrema lepadinum]
MDHVQLAEAATHEPLEVPDQCLDHYPQGTPFQIYPSIKQWTRKAPFGDDFEVERRPLEEATSFLQNWLFFGLRTSLLGPAVPLEDFRRKTLEGKNVITTSKLPEHVHALEERDQNLIDVQIEHRRSNADQCLLTAHKVLSFVYGGTTIDMRILLSLSALGDYLTSIRNTLYNFHQPGNLLYLTWNLGSPSSSGIFQTNFISERLLHDGWCKSQVRRIFRMSPSGAYYISNLPRPDPERSHEECSMWQCGAYQMQWETYQTSHAQNGCDCSFVFADTRQLCSILADGKIPVIPTDTPIEEGIPIAICEARRLKYVAISHVWSDGLGNPWHNALPQCQLRRICNSVKNLHQSDEPSFFWVDTICCPRESIEARLQAIALMGETYNGANKTLVLDNYLQSTPAASMSDFEKLARLFVSGWVTRLWTLQECVLSPMNFLQFSDMAVDFTWTLICLINSSNYKAEKHVFTDFMMKIRGVWVFTRDSTPFATLQELSEVVYERSTSVATDEPICLANLLGLDMHQLMKADPAARMKRFWELQEAYSGDLIFWSGYRLKDKGYRWAPASFMNQRLAMLPGDIESNKDSPAFRTESGLKVTYPGVILGCLNGHRPGHTFWLRDANRDWTYWIECQKHLDEPSATGYSPPAGFNSDLEAAEFAIIFREPPILLTKGLRDMSNIDCALVLVEKQENEDIFVTLQTTARLYHAVPGVMEKDALYEAMSIKGKVMEARAQQGHGSEADDMNEVIIQDKHYCFDGDWRDEKQVWFVD